VIHMQQELEHTRASLQSESLSHTGTHDEYTKLSHQADENSMLRESNTTLREEKKRLTEK
jgi:hypothetical protein